MDFQPSAAQQALAERTRAYAEAHLRAGVVGRERAHRIGLEVIAGLAQAGLLGVNVPSSLGGQEAGAVAYAMALREVAAVDAAVALTMAVTNMVAETLVRFGTPAQRERFVPRLTRGEVFGGSFALSEAGAGSDAASLSTCAVRDGSHWVLNGQKMWITSGDQAGVWVVWARSSAALGAAGISCFLVEHGTPGVSFGKPEDKMGLRASHTVTVSFQDVRVPAEHVLGEPGHGFKIAMTALDGGRVGISAQSVGLASAALVLVRAHVAERGRAEEQGTMFALADMATSLDAAWLLTLRAAWGKERDQPFTRQAAMAKVFASEAANRIIRQALQLTGEYGYMEDAGLARLFRDCRVTQVYEGTSEIQRLVISREIFKNAG